ncbi:hypothetical protein [Lysobacter enzymogenes]|uniref:Lipoprotein n=1 Tax=Lysobacter enzymogenes TaxID=69 RepID=A0A3N2RDK0_LYSEN|nr:hypothetical protein [Lysobacter enzymogenes]ROU05507.1 hypothetical protein D9T17_17530 [Lysobacter enzymogenes]
MRRLAFVPLAALWLAACSAPLPAPAPGAREAAPAPTPAGPALRAIGTEPGWLAEVGPGESPTIRLELDYGERKLVVRDATRLEEVSGYTGYTADGVWVSLNYRREQCSDGMSDRDYIASVELQVGDRHYRGCAASLAP